MRWLIALIVWGGSLVGGVALSNAVVGGVHQRSAGAQASQAALPSKPPFDPSTVKAGGARSLLLGANFSKALAVAERHLGRKARAKVIQIYPGQLLLTVDRHGKEANDIVEANDAWQGGSTSPAQPEKNFRLSATASDAPRVLVARLAAKAHVRVSQITYIAVQANPEAAGLLYSVYGADPSRYYQAASPRGPITRLGGPRPVIVR